jgi:glycosyltransferase involved in cell wall biosynthesis
MICHSIASLRVDAGGPSRSVSQLCKELIINNESLCIVTTVDADQLIVDLDSSIYLKKVGVNLSILSRLLNLCGFTAALHELNSERTIRLIHQHGIWLRSSHATTRFAYANSLPLIIAPRGMLEPWAINNSKWKKKLAWLFYQKRDLKLAVGFHATAQSEADSIRCLGFKQPIAVIPNGVELPLLETKVPNSEDVKPKIRTALFLSRINPKKGLPMLLDAWAQIAPVGWRLIIAGNDDSNHLPKVEAKIAELKLKEQVEVAGSLFGEAKEEAFRNADLFILPSYSENFGIVVAEALSYGIPVLTTTGCPWQELQTNACGWWVEPTLDGIKSGLDVALATTGEQLAEMGTHGRNLVEANYQWPGIAEKMNLFYKWIVDGGEQPDFVV